MSHIWGLLTHPDREMHDIAKEHETVSHHYVHHVLMLAAIPVICAFIGTTQVGWNLGSGHIPLQLSTALLLGIVFYAVILGGVALMGNVIHWLARDYPQRPTLKECTVFAGYIATPMFLSGLVALYPMVWLCLLVGAAGLLYSGYLLFLAVPSFLNIAKEESLRVSGSIFAIGILVFEFMLGLGVVIWGFGAYLF
ncbi:Yip1 family protein [Gallaecimonas mangrovi]|uniref:Yip1 family protein n=1 Tax=Gallaecimonas mangrovi TaxID=2291597 RepID=UPI000E20B0BA|nr:Yip1 family protein [Gallaecimonas mangrovi]